MPTTLVEGAAVAPRLLQLGITPWAITDAVAAGEIARRSCTDHDTKSAPGFYAWNETTRGLRDRTVGRGWHAAKDGLETVTRDDGRIAIVVATGDEGTGDSARVSHNAHPKGSETIRAICRNNAYPRFDFANPAVNPTSPGISAETWVLLIRSAEEGARCELSRPNTIDDTGRVIAWDERIILPTVPPELSPAGDDQGDLNDDGPAAAPVRQAN